MPCVLHIDPISVDDLEVWDIRDVKLFLTWLAIISMEMLDRRTPVAQIRMSSSWSVPSLSTIPSGAIL